MASEMPSIAGRSCKADFLVYQLMDGWKMAGSPVEV
jgi:hypothetical protein